MSKVIKVRKPGGPEVLEMVDVSLPSPDVGEVRVKHTAIPVNFSDITLRKGLMPATFPAGIGVEAVGIVEQVGPNVDTVQAGEKVAYFSPQPGAYAERRNIPATAIIKLPRGLDTEMVAASLSKGLTAHYLLRQTIEVKEGNWVVIQAAAGGVGSIMVQWAKALGANVIGLVSSSTKVDFAAKLGCDHVLHYDEDWGQKVKGITNGGADVVYDSLGNETFEKSMKALRPRGMLVSFGNASGPPPEISPMALMMHGSIYLTRTSGKDYFGTPEEIKLGAEAYFKMLETEKISITISKRFRLEQASSAHEAIESRSTTGCTLLIPQHSDTL